MSQEVPPRTVVRIVATHEEGQRLDRFVSRHYPSLHMGLVQKALRCKDIRVNGLRAAPSYHLRSGDEVRLFRGLLNTVTDAEKEAQQKARLHDRHQELADQLRKQCLLETDTFVVINKRYGQACQGGTGVDVSVDRALEVLYGQKMYLVHRLDRETSGALLVARQPSSARFFMSAFLARRIHKSYIALLMGHLPDSMEGGVYTSWMKKEALGRHESMHHYDTHRPGSQKAETRFFVLQKNDTHSLVCMHPYTGRRHQLRAQTKALGAPIVGDARYGEGVTKGPLFLHARCLRFPCPISKKEYKVEAPFPTFFKERLDQLGWQDAALSAPKGGREKNQDR
ncbi:RluA family pseudouridine synthase [Candidatus Hepatobacter penaei]|uniref:RluA family pseudouridine synthase n=1 Tax=Candidatus Hepatobacter penaei TaxID=1274402 RepID=UPI0004F3527E|nr:RluA family pseudouridine synthase [Candidatus Hepatobacter penaei]